MACISCKYWKHDGMQSVNDLLYGYCKKHGQETAHDREGCKDYKKKPAQREIMAKTTTEFVKRIKNGRAYDGDLIDACDRLEQADKEIDEQTKEIKRLKKLLREIKKEPLAAMKIKQVLKDKGE